ncbi:MAG: transcriptional repressor [Clostridia bacterium]
MAERMPYRTRAQKELLELLKAAPGRHFTAAEIKDYFAAENKPIGTATIYRQLERFVEDGSIRRFVLGPGECACYAYTEDQQCSSHFHCVCEICGKLIHMDCGELRDIEAHLLEHHGFAWDFGKTVFYGICEQCRNA